MKARPRVGLFTAHAHACTHPHPSQSTMAFNPQHVNPPPLLGRDGFAMGPPQGPHALGDGGVVRRVGPNGDLVDVGADQIKMFGLPQYGDPTINPMGSVNKTYETFPEAWGGAYGRPVSNNHIALLLIKTIKAVDRFMPTVIFPIRLNLDGSTKFSVSQLVYNDHNLDRVPELGVPRMLTQHSNQWQVNIPRYGLGFFMEHGFAMTERGKMQYDCSLQQITNATWDTIDQEAYAHMFQSAASALQVDAIWKHHGAPFGQEAKASDIIAYECSIFGALNRMQNPMVTLRNRAEEMMGRRGITPDVCIVPHGAPLLIKEHPSQTRMMTGAEAARNALKSAEGALEGPVPGMRVFTAALTQNYANNNWELPEDPLVRTRTVGEYFKVLHPCRDVATGENYPEWSTIWVHDNDTDQMAPILLGEVEANCPFTPDILRDLIRATHDFDNRPQPAEIDNTTWQEFIDLIQAKDERAPWGTAVQVGNVVAAFNRHCRGALVVDSPRDGILAALKELRGNHILSPFNYLVMRPFEHWQMGSMIFTLSGGRVGFTSIGQANFQLSQDGMRKFLLGTFTVNVGVVVTNRDGIFVMHNVMYKAYENGGGTKFWRPDQAERIGRMSASQGDVIPSLLVAPIPNFETVDRAHIDIVGYFSASDVQAEMPPHYSTALSVANAWRVAGTQEQFFCDTAYQQRIQASRGLGSRMSQGHQLMCVREDGRRCRAQGQQLIGTGHHGAYSYAGVRADRLGMGPTGYVRTMTGYEELPTYMRGW